MNYLPKITEIWAYVSVEEHGEGIIGETCLLPDIGKTFMPFVCADKIRMESLRPHAERIAKELGKKIKLIRLSMREEIEDIG